MNDKARALLRRDRLVIAGALGVIAIFAWAYVVWLARTAPDMHGRAMDFMAPTLETWSSTRFLFSFAMWAVMMVGMMTPAVTPMILLYATAGRQARGAGSPFAPTGWFAAGYFLSWILFAFVATIAESALGAAALLTPSLSSASHELGGALLVLAGLLQWSPLKDACLKECQAPLSFIQRHGGFRAEAFGSLRLGFLHGGYCIGCCWTLMALLFVGGVMNVLWIAGLAALILVERVISGRLIARTAGILLVAAGLWLLVSDALVT